MSEELKITEIREKFQDEWVVALITQRDQYMTFRLQAS